MATAWITQGIAERAGLSTQEGDLAKITEESFVQGIIAHGQVALIRAGVRGGLESAMGEKPNWKDLGLNAAADTLSGVMANEIGQWYDIQDLDFFTHKLLHATTGFATGYIRSKGDMKWAFAEGAGQGMGETFADLLGPDENARHERLLAAEKAKGAPLTEQEKRVLSHVLKRDEK